MTTWRQRQAVATRRQIVRAARRLFVASGYAATTVEAIAAEAGVAVATVYKVFGTKAAIARELNGAIDEEGRVAWFAQRIAAESDPTELLRLTVSQNRRLFEACGDIIATVRSGAAVDAALADVYAEGTRRHDEGMRWVVEKIDVARGLRPELDRKQAVGLLSTLCSIEAFADLTGRYGWSLDDCERWILGALRRLLLAA